MPHWTDANWHQGTDAPAGLAAIIQAQIRQQQPEFQRVLSEINLQTAAGPGLHAPALPALQGKLHSILAGLGPAFDRALAGQDAGIANNPAFDAATKSLSEFSSAVLAANVRLGQLSDVHHPAFNLGGLATIASPAIGELFGSVAGVLSQNFGALAASVQPAIEGLHRMVEAVTDMGRWRGPASPVLGPPSPTGAPTPSVGAANVTLNAPLTAMVDGRETANILANRFLPQIQRAIDQHKQQLAGAAQSAILNQTMGGG
jgi:hypothetical protein